MNNIIQAIKSNLNIKGIRFFMPGHKGRESFMGDIFSKKQLNIDITELDGTDNLHNPTGPILEAQEMTATAFQSEHCFYLVNGSTAGIFAAISSCTKAGDTIIVDRGCHYSVINAITLFDLNPIYLVPEFDEKFEIYSHIEPKSLEALLSENSNVKAVIITSPTYYGRCSNIKQLAKIAHSYNAPLLVDEAHGAHLCFSDLLPPSAMESGADCAVQSAHKTLPCPTQCAYLQINSYYLPKKTVLEKLNIFQTSSPSYLFMASLENAAIVMKEKGEKELNRIIKCCEDLCDALEETGKIQCFRGPGQDPTRLVFNLSRTNVKGHEFKKLLEDKGIYVEMAEGFNVVLIATISNTNKDFMQLKKVVLKLLKGLNLRAKLPDIPFLKEPNLPAPIVKLTPHKAYNMASTEVIANKAVGKIAARSVYLVPPGIPLVCPGEIVQPNILKYYQDKITIIKENGEL